MNVQTAHRTAFAQRGLRPSTATTCPRVVAGKRCTRSVDCICHRHHRILDHARTWIDDHGQHVLTAEPYQADSDTLVVFLTELHALGLRSTLAGNSPWNPGGTFIIYVEVSPVGDTYLADKLEVTKDGTDA